MFYHLDALGSVVATVNGSQQLSSDQRFDAFGNKGWYIPFGSTFGFAAKAQYRTDAESGLMLLGHRYYDPTVGRFISQDPAQDESNWYAYCGNNPLVATDPTGLVKKSSTEPEPEPEPKGPPKSYERGELNGQPGTWKTYKDGSRSFEPDAKPPVKKRGHGDGGRNQGADEEHKRNAAGNQQAPQQQGQAPQKGQNVRRAAVATGAVAGGAAVVYGLYVGAKWIAAALLAPETGGGSLAVG